MLVNNWLRRLFGCRAQYIYRYRKADTMNIQPGPACARKFFLAIFVTMVGSYFMILSTLEYNKYGSSRIGHISISLKPASIPSFVKDIE